MNFLPHSSKVPCHALSLLVGVLALACRVEAVPEVVEQTFKGQYPGAKDVHWKVDRHGHWEATFEREGEDYRADYREDGEWVETESDIDFGELPDAVQMAVREEYGGETIREVERVVSPQRGVYFDVEFQRHGQNQDVEFLPSGEKVGTVMGAVESAAGTLFEPFQDLNGKAQQADQIGKLELLMEFAFNILTIVIYAYFIYYRRHHDHKMLFLLLGFNLFLFPIFLLNTVLTVGFGFTIFALLALVRLRSQNFDKAEVAYLLGAVSLTFINSVLPARVEYFSSAVVLLTAYLGDHPRIWRDAYQTTRIRLSLDDMSRALDTAYLRDRLEDEFDVEVNDIEIRRVRKKQVRLRVMYRSRSTRGDDEDDD